MPSLAIKTDELDRLLAEYATTATPGLAIGVQVAGRPVYAQCRGLSGFGGDTPLTTATKMRIFSCTKQYACLALLMLCEDGLADIDDSVGRFFPHLSASARQVTLHQLMTNTSGLADAFDIRYFTSGTDVEVRSRDMVDLYSGFDAVNFMPGSSYCYNNGGYNILSSVIEHIDDSPLEDVLRKRVFEPLGMGNSFLRRSERSYHRNTASLHVGSYPLYSRDYLRGEYSGDGGAVSTVYDLLAWLAHQNAASHPRFGPFIEMMRKKTRLTNGVFCNYGMGVISDAYRGEPVYFHAGGAPGGSCHLAYLPRFNTGVCVLSNRDDVSAVLVANRVLDILLDLPAETDVVPLKANLSGLYVSAKSKRIFEFSVSGAHQYLAINGFKIRMGTRDGTIFHRTAPNNHEDMSVQCFDDGDRPIFHSFGSEEALIPIEQMSNPANDPQRSWRGSNDRIASSIRLDGTELRVRGQWGSAAYRLTPVAPAMWHAEGERPGLPQGIVSLPNEDRLEIKTYRAWSTTFERER